MEEKIKMIDEYINKLNDVIDRSDSTLAKDFEEEIIAVYSKEISALTNGLSRFRQMDYIGYNPLIDYLKDATILKAKLVNYKNNLLGGLFTSQNKNEGVFVTQQVNQENIFLISFEQTINNIKNLPDKVISEEEKEILLEKISAIEAAGDKKTCWEKAQNVLKWIAEKGIEVGIAVLPYIVHSIQL